MTGRAAIAAATVSKEGHAYIRLRETAWANPQAYARFSVVRTYDGSRTLGPWMHLFDRLTQEVIGVPTPQVHLLVLDPDMTARVLEEDHDVYTGPLDPADTP